MFLHERKIFLVVRNQSGRGGGGTGPGVGMGLLPRITSHR